MRSIAVPSPLGDLYLSFTKQGLSRLALNQPERACEILDFEEARDYRLQFEQYFSGIRQVFDIRLDLGQIPAFQQEVLRMVQLIPYGRIRTYKQIALSLGNAKFARAVGQALQRNPIPIVVPCHRVLGNGGELTGFVFGLDTKQKLLSLENPRRVAAQAALFD